MQEAWEFCGAINPGGWGKTSPYYIPTTGKRPSSNECKQNSWWFLFQRFSGQMSPAQGIVRADMSKMDWDDATYLHYPINLYLVVTPASVALASALGERFSLDPQQAFARKGTCTKGTSKHGGDVIGLMVQQFWGRKPWKNLSSCPSLSRCKSAIRNHSRKWQTWCKTLYFLSKMLKQKLDRSS